ncbi:MAG: phenylalanine--tRNA ligase subunit alpha [Candidatus Omnitrophica bacterium]|jgi:phenylalanyl-tRNA synthetase alpha chain|nr:phenylalanine--tRNA ligase subunit alpha [Candidatus Omnitrophota bacterium]
MEQKIKNLKEEFQKDFGKINNQQDLEAIEVKYLGRKSLLTQLFSQIPTLEPKERSLWGKRLNSFKEEISSFLKEKRQSYTAAEESWDLTFPGNFYDNGSIHILNSVNEQICTIFEKLGFMVIEGNEIEDEWHNFEALNIPLEHPSRDAFDTFYLDIPPKNKGKYLLRSHTSPSQIRVMQKMTPPLAVISPGRVYRPDEVDATHSFMFHQIEGFVIDEEVSFATLKGVLLYFAKEFFSQDARLRFRPHFFPFTEPSAEADVSCIICQTQERNKRNKPNKHKCSVCKGKGWLEILGCGMIHPKVLEACGIDFKRYRGFAFGMGVDRIAMLKYGINDIRLFYENDVRFLNQFPL